MKRLTCAWRRIVRDFVRDEQGTEVLEWALVCSLIVIGAIAAITIIGPKVKNQWDAINAALP
jgi:Flp pilus assembly pilin Flp